MIRTILTNWITATIMTLALVGGISLAFTQPVSAADPKHELCSGTGGTIDEQGKCVKAGESTLTDIVKDVVNVLLFVVGVASVIMLVVGGIRFVVSAGDSNAVQGARNTIIYAIVGIVIAFSAFAISNFIINRL